MKRILIGAAAAAIMAGAASGIAHAGSQSSNTNSNSSSNNGVVRERVVDSYCANGYCQRYVARRVYRDDRRGRRTAMSTPRRAITNPIIATGGAATTEFPAAQGASRFRSPPPGGVPYSSGAMAAPGEPSATFA